MNQYLAIILLLASSPVWAQDIFYRFGTDKFANPSAEAAYIQILYNNENRTALAQEYFFKSGEGDSSFGAWHSGPAVTFSVSHAWGLKSNSLLRAVPNQDVVTYDRKHFPGGPLKKCEDDPGDKATMIDSMMVKTRNGWKLISTGEENCNSLNNVTLYGSSQRDTETWRTHFRAMAEEALYGESSDKADTPLDEAAVVASYRFTVEQILGSKGQVNFRVEVNENGMARAYLETAGRQVFRVKGGLPNPNARRPIMALNQTQTTRWPFDVPAPAAEFFVGQSYLNKLLELHKGVETNKIVRKKYDGPCEARIGGQYPRINHLQIAMSSSSEPWKLVAMSLGCEYGYIVRPESERLLSLANELKSQLLRLSVQRINYQVVAP